MSAVLDNSIRCPCLATDALAALPWADRMRAYGDYDEALTNWRIARLHRRLGNWQWQLDMRRAVRFLRHYKRAVRAAQGIARRPGCAGHEDRCMSYIRANIADFRAQWHDILEAYPELGEDEGLKADVLDAETDFHKLVDGLVKRKLDAREMASGAKARKQEVGERQSRFERQEAGYDTLIKSLMQFADMQKVVLPEATVSITKPRTRVNIIDAEALPQGYFVTERKPKSADIKAALEAGEEIPGAELVLGDDGLMVRTK